MKKRKVRKPYKKWRKGKISKDNYVETRRGLRKMIRKKREKKKEAVVEEIRNIKTESQI